MKFIGMLVAIVCAIPTNAAPPPSKPAWRWTTDERLAARVEEEARNQRDVVHGSEHPELLMRFEIMNAFTQAAFAEDDETSRVVKQDALRKAIALGLPSTFMSDFERAASAFIHQRREEQRLRKLLYTGTKVDRASVSRRFRLLQQQECGTRADAVRKLTQQFGERFDRFLYTAIAPGVFRESDEPLDERTLRNEENGCK